MGRILTGFAFTTVVKMQKQSVFIAKTASSMLIICADWLFEKSVASHITVFILRIVVAFIR